MLRYKIRIPDYYMCVLIFWFGTEFLLGTTLKSFLGVSTEFLNQLQAYIVLGLVLIQIVAFQNYTVKEIVMIATVSVLIIIAVIRSGEIVLMSFWVFVIAGKNIDFDRVVRMIYRMCWILTIFVIALYYIGVLEDYTVYRGTIFRSSLGFSHPNMLGQRLFLLVACHFYLRFHTLDLRDYLLAVAACIFCYVVPNSQTAVILLLAMIVGIFIYKIFQRMGKELWFMGGLIVASAGCNVISILLSSIDVRKNQTLWLLNVLLSRRFSACHTILQLYGVSWFGQKVYITANERALVGIKQALYCDNAYCSILVTYGIIVYALFSCIYLYNMYLQIKKQKVALVFFLFLISVYGIMEHTLFALSANIFLLTLKDVIYRNPSSAMKEKIHSIKHNR